MILAGIQFYVQPNTFLNWGAGTESNDFSTKKYNLSSETDGYINIKIKYDKTYSESDSTKGISAFANINDAGDLTIATNTATITGLVRLKFTNTDSGGTERIFYSDDVFYIGAEYSTIYCQIANDYYSWYGEDWKVEVISLANNKIKEGKVEFYTIRDKTGLVGFSNAVNGTKGSGYAKTKDRSFYLIQDIASVGNMDPIGGYREVSWFDGFFSGGCNIEKVTNFRRLDCRQRQYKNGSWQKCF